MAARVKKNKAIISTGRQDFLLWWPAGLNNPIFYKGWVRLTMIFQISRRIFVERQTIYELKYYAQSQYIQRCIWKNMFRLAQTFLFGSKLVKTPDNFRFFFVLVASWNVCSNQLSQCHNCSLFVSSQISICAKVTNRPGNRKNEGEIQIVELMLRSRPLELEEFRVQKSFVSSIVRYL